MTFRKKKIEKEELALTWSFKGSSFGIPRRNYLLEMPVEISKRRRKRETEWRGFEERKWRRGKKERLERSETTKGKMNGKEAKKRTRKANEWRDTCERWCRFRNGVSSWYYYMLDRNYLSLTRVTTCWRCGWKWAGLILQWRCFCNGVDKENYWSRIRAFFFVRKFIENLIFFGGSYYTRQWCRALI